MAAKIQSTKKVTKVPVKAPIKAPVKAKASVKAPVKAPIKAPAKAAVKAKTPVKAPAKALEKAKAPVKSPVEVAVKVKTAPVKTKEPAKTVLDTSVREVHAYSLDANEEYMNDTQQAHFKELLKAWRATLVNKLDTAVSHLKDEPKHFADLNDRASQEEEFNIELRARDREADFVVNIDEALKRLHEGDYGYCEDCGIEIGIRRLEARPTATLCIDCKTLAEMRERQAGGL